MDTANKFEHTNAALSFPIFISVIFGFEVKTGTTDYVFNNMSA